MRRIFAVFVIGFIGLILISGCENNLFTGNKGSQGTAKKVAVEDLSQPIDIAIKTAFPDGTIEEVTLEDENGTEIYEAEVRTNETTYEVKVTLDGKLIEIEQEITPGELPEVVVNAVNDLYPGASIEEAEKITRGGNVIFEIELKSGGKEFEIELDGNGTVVQKEIEYGDQNDSDDDNDDTDMDNVENEHEYEGEEEGEH